MRREEMHDTEVHEDEGHGHHSDISFDDASQKEADLSSSQFVQKQDTVTEKAGAINKVKPSSLLPVMKIVPDKQDLGFVEKVQVIESRVVQICNQLVLGSTENRYPDIKINYQMLNRISLPTVGIYGDKIMMARILKRMGVTGDWTNLKGNLEAGLYVSPLKHCIVVFYWHEGSGMEEASRKQMSCNFIRYLVDLCDDICVLVEEDNLMDVLPDSVYASRSQASGKRTRRIKVFKVQNSSDDVCISPGFKVTLEKEMVGLQNPKDLFTMPMQGPFFSQGHHRCGYIAPAFKETKKHIKTDRLSFAVSDLPSEIEKWYKDSVLDFSGLNNDDFVRFLEHSGLPQFQQKYHGFMQSRSEQEQSQLSADSKLQRAQDRILLAIMKALPETHTFLKYMQDSDESNAEESAGGSLEQVEQVYAEVCGGRKLVFPGSQITFKFSNGSHFKGQISAKSFWPITFEQNVTLRKESGSTCVAYFHRESAKGTPVLVGENVTLMEKETRKRVGVITEVQTPSTAIRGWVEKLVPASLKNTHANFCLLCFLVSEGVAKELKDLGEGFIAEIGKGTYSGNQFLPQLLANMAVSNEGQSLNLDGIKEFVLGGNASAITEKLDQAASKLQGDVRCHFAEWKKKFSKFMLDKSAVVSNGTLSMKDWNGLCKEIGDSIKDTIKEKAVPMIRKNMILSLQRRFEEERLVLKKRLAEEHDRLLLEMKCDLSNYYLGKCVGGGTRRKMCLKSYNIKTNWSGHSKIDIVVSTEGMEKPAVLWRFTEVAPNTQDLHKIFLNPMHSINPLCTKFFELRMDPETQELKMVAFLKSGRLLVFVREKSDDQMFNPLNVYVSSKPGSVLARIGSFHRGIDLISFEESTRFLALYDAEIAKVSIYRFDEGYGRLHWKSVDLSLQAVLSGKSKLVWMLCIPGKHELLLLDDANRIRVAELDHVPEPMILDGYVDLPSQYICGCITEDGCFLFLLLKPCSSTPGELSHSVKGLEPGASTSQEQSNDNLHVVPEVRVYLLGGTISELKSISLDMLSHDVTDLELKLVNYGGQKHLVVFSKSKPDVLTSYVLKTTLVGQKVEFNEVQKKKQAAAASVKSSRTLEYLYHIYDKFAIQPALFRETKRSLNFHVLLKPSSVVGSNAQAIIDRCNSYLNSLLGRINDKGKHFINYEYQVHTETVDRWEAENGMRKYLGRAQKKAMGEWIRQLVCLVPVQICQANNNGIQPLANGLQIPSDVAYGDSISLANLLRFGMYDSILRQWDGCIKVISSIGMQGSGKSYLLNHLSGSLLDVAGGRCTDGVWMTIRIVSNCLYVIMDFKGFGSFEQSDQQDMLFCVLNAALSNVTIFNKKDFHLDLEMERVFNIYDQGASLVKYDENLFRGVFDIAIKDVDASDAEKLLDEFERKFQQICKSPKEDFLTKMYRGQFVISAMPYFARHEYHKDGLEEIATTVEELDQSYEEGRSFLRDLKIVIAQIATKDWSPVDVNRVGMKIDLIRKHIVTAVKAGCLGSNRSLVNFDTQEEICDDPVNVAGMVFRIEDTGLELVASEGPTNTTETILGSLRRRFERVIQRRGIKEDEWHAKLQEFLQALAERRHQRVIKWVRCNTCEFSENNEMQKLQLEVTLALAQVKQEMAICGGKCSVCFWRCVLNKGHSTTSHSCMGSHVCAEKCSYCCSKEAQVKQEMAICGGKFSLCSWRCAWRCALKEGHSTTSHSCMGSNVCAEKCSHYCPNEYCDENDQTKVLECLSLAGHEGNHDCREKNHTCMNPCTFSGSSSNCDIKCGLKVGHEGVHRCNTPQHICNSKCSLPGCQNLCLIQIETGNHQKHACHERSCPKKCVMKGCTRSCGFHDHFHQLTSNQHLCGNQHPCPEKCEAEGICRIITELFQQTRSLDGTRGGLRYEDVPEQNGVREECCIPVPPFQVCHQGAHVHTRNPNPVHYCGVKCQGCGYCCDLRIKHEGLHNTVHGTMRNVRFSSDMDEFQIQDGKSVWGESGMTEMCNLHCRTRGGRGHIHLINCPSTGIGNDTNSSGSCLGGRFDGARHQTKEYEPDLKVPKDELTHKAYWLQMGFQDPYSEEDREEFELCNSFCMSDEHLDKDGDGKRQRSYCTQKLLHEPVKSAPDADSHVTPDGHVFKCKHWHGKPHHVIFVVDRSGSMGSTDQTPQMPQFQKSHKSRLGCVYEAMLRFIATRMKVMPSGDMMSVVLFDHDAEVGLKMAPLCEDVVDDLMCRYSPRGSTSYSAGLDQTHQVLVHGCHHANYSNLTPVVIFFSDGGNTDDSSKPDPVSLVEQIRKTDPRCVVNTVMFGNCDSDFEILKWMAAAGNGKFCMSDRRAEFCKSFEQLVKGLDTNVGALPS